MKHLTFASKEVYKVCFLVNSIQSYDIEKEYLSLLNVTKEDVLILDLYKDPMKKKTSVSSMKEYLVDVKEVLQEFKCTYVVICNSDYYKVFSHEPKAEVNLGYIKEVDSYKVLYVPDYKSIFYDPDRTRAKIKRSLTAINKDIEGFYSDPGLKNLSMSLLYDSKDIEDNLNKLLSKDKLTCDIETYSLRPHLAGLASITFCWNDHEGLAFPIDSSAKDKNEIVRKSLKEFFERFEGVLIFHNISFDASVLIYQLWMNDITDTEGLLKGLQVMLKNFEDTKLIAYLATNSCAGNELGLKALAQDFAGNYAQEDINDVTKIPLKQLLEYNVVDGLSTWYVYNKYYPLMVQDNQESIYKNLFKPSTIDIIQMQLTGFPLSMQRVKEVEKILQKDRDTAIETLNNNSIVKNYIDVLEEEFLIKRNAELKKKQLTREDIHIEFNPRSRPQLQELLYGILNLPVLNKTDSGLPSTDSSTISSLLNHTTKEEVKEILQALIDFSAVDKILSAFIPSFLDAVYSPKTNWHYLIGNFNLGGTVSGRLSSSNPNLQQLPATGSKYAKLIKSCFIAPKGWLLCGLDFSALEDHISALTTKDSNKLKVYLDNYDGHCLRAFSYFHDQMEDIQEKLDYINTEEQLYEVIDDSGHVQVLKESDIKEFL